MKILLDGALEPIIKNVPVLGTAKPLSVMIDARKLGHGGIGVYLNNLISGLVETENSRVMILGDQAKVARFPWAEQVTVVEEKAGLYSLEELFMMPRRLQTVGFDVFHAPHFTLPYGLKCPKVMTLHDLIHVYDPQKPYYPYIAAPLIHSAVRRADKIIAVSKSTYHDLAKFVHDDPRILAKTRVIPNAIDPAFKEPLPDPRFLHRRFKLSGRYLIAIFSNLKPHKGAEDLLSAFGELKRHARAAEFSDVRLVLVGQGTESLPEVGKLLELSGALDRVHVLGRVSKEELRYLYGGAHGLVVASRAEGFCLPVIEAHAMGCPVLSRPIPAVLELVSHDDLICADLSRQALYEGLATFLLSRGPQAPEQLLSERRARHAETYRSLLHFDYRELAKVVRATYVEAAQERAERRSKVAP